MIAPNLGSCRTKPTTYLLISKFYKVLPTKVRVKELEVSEDNLIRKMEVIMVYKPPIYPNTELVISKYVEQYSRDN